VEIYGQSSHTGFLLRITTSRATIELTTIGYTEDLSRFPFWTRVLFSVVFYGGTATFLLAAISAHLFPFLLTLIYGIAFAVWWYVAAAYIKAFCFFAIEHSTRRWHGCEHKLVRLYAKNRPRTQENLVKARRTTIFCGGTEACVMIVAPIFLAIAVLSPVPLILYGLGILFLPAVVVSSFAAQYFLTTAPPNDEHYADALELATRIDTELKK